MRYRYQPHGVCSQMIEFDIDDNNKLHDVVFYGGCNGNLKAISKLVEGMDADKVVALLKGNDCGGRGTSCADQFTKGIEMAMTAEEK